MILLLLCGCKNKYIVCNIDINNKELNYNLKGEYKIYYKKSNVIKIEKQEKFTSSDKKILNYLKESKDIEISSLNQKYNGYLYEIKSDRKSVDVKTYIDVSLINLQDMVNDEYLSKYYVNNNKLTVGGIKLFYESKGATCN